MQFSCTSLVKEVTVLSAPAGDRYTEIDRDGVTVIPNGRLLFRYYHPNQTQL